MASKCISRTRRRAVGSLVPRIGNHQMNQYLLFFIGMAPMVMVPGPDFMNVVRQSLRGSFRNGLMSAAAGSCGHVTAAILGLSAILLSSTIAYEAVRWAGAAYLIFLGIRSLFSRSSGELTRVSGHTLSNRPINRAFRKAFLINVLNPKAALTFMAFMPQFVHPEKGRV
jgi:threonine/homoserine/homoserine lactone efflux protein